MTSRKSAGSRMQEANTGGRRRKLPLAPFLLSTGLNVRKHSITMHLCWISWRSKTSLCEVGF
jgi:hypothetical protein